MLTAVFYCRIFILQVLKKVLINYFKYIEYLAHSEFLGKVIIMFVSTYSGVSPLSTGVDRGKSREELPLYSKNSG